MKKISFLFFLACSLTAQAQPSAKLGVNSIDEVVKAMTLEEKAQLLVGASMANFSGVGATVGNTLNLVSGAAGTTVPFPRLGIPATVVSDGPAGVRISPKRDNDNATYYCTGFPIATLLASTWNTDLVKSVGKAMGNEVLEYGCDVLLGPGMNTHRNPLCGRNFEYYSEDPLITGKMAAAMVSGVQSQGVGTSIKHFAGNNQETLRTKNDARITQRALREIYLKGFEIAVKEAQPWTIMSSYNRINGSYTQENYELLTTILRDEWGFKGLVMTDWTGERNTVAQVHAGNDLMMPGQIEQANTIVSKVKSGELSEADVDVCVKRMLHYIMLTPRFRQYKYSNKPDLKAHAAITRSSAAEGMVLLKNDNAALPIAAGLQNIALFGNTSYNFIAGGTGSGDVNKAYVVDLQQGLQNAGFGIQPKIKAVYEKYKTYQDEKLQDLNNSRSWFLGPLRPEEISFDELFLNIYAEKSDIAIITFGRNSGEGNDRGLNGDFELNQSERALLNGVTRAFHAKGKKVVVILNIGGVIETASWKHLPDAILLAWQAGQEGGNTVADVLKGAVNPSGHLAMTFPVDYIDHPSSRNFPAGCIFTWDDEQNPLLLNKKDIGYTNYDEDIWIGYRYFSTNNKEVSYPFGFGLSYTTFSYSNASVKKTGSEWKVSVKVTNTGKVAGKEVAQVYVKAAPGEIKKPLCELKAFGKTQLLAPGQSETLTMTIKNSDLASFNEDKSAWVVDAGQYTALIGASVADIRQSVPFSVAKPQITEVHNVMKLNSEINRMK
ncbi:glycoside hydrolase family 3 N-terminal domain-containing protein [uncultured Bacteroides sp.]|uniref:glycoside hydrolase family 3 N-terminal domain-containing protein n=1 Tax=uncultured Bacteroides sp. TaxID=162156 RepID=UPI002AAAA4BC|nr:glycoside hydrolase family 3 N-terminal domain-containing protein [uncultured Bacteroides sp.]